MGHQVNFFVLPADLAQLQRSLGKLEPMKILRDRSTSAQPSEVAGFDASESGAPLLFYYLVRECDLAGVVTRHVPAQGVWTVDVLRSPVVQLNSSYFDGELLRRGRVYYVDGYYSEDSQWVIKSESFLRWGKAVLKTTRGSLKRHGADYVGDAALQWLAESEGKLEM